jgi:hypothetical protein
MKHGWLFFGLALAGAVALDFITSRQILPERDMILRHLLMVFAEDSVFASKYFVNATIRSIVALSGILVISIVALSVRRGDARTIIFYLRPKLFPFILLGGVLLYLQPIGNIFLDFPYTPAIFFSLMLVVIREHFFFFSQQWFSEDGRGVLLGGGIGLVGFIYLHPLVLNEARILTTALMINLWVYTMCARNLWMGIAVHSLWNFVMPDSTVFYYVVFLLSCFLAFGRPSYPKFLVPSWALRIDTFGRFSLIWWRFWSYPERSLGGLKAVVFRQFRSG